MEVLGQKQILQLALNIFPPGTTLMHAIIEMAIKKKQDESKELDLSAQYLKSLFENAHGFIDSKVTGTNN